MITKYHAKTIFKGYAIGLENDKMYVGVPEKKLNHTCMVIHDRLYMVIKKGTPPVAKYFQEGKIGTQGVKIAPDFFLAYFPWNPYKKRAVKDEVGIINGLVSTLSLDQIRELKEIIKGKLKINKTL